MRRWIYPGAVVAAVLSMGAVIGVILAEGPSSAPVPAPTGGGTYLVFAGLLLAVRAGASRPRFAARSTFRTSRPGPGARSPRQGTR
jgi:hypothetical protein